VRNPMTTQETPSDDKELRKDLCLIHAALNWCGCLDGRYSDVMERAHDAARDALERITDRLGVLRDDC